MFLLMRKNKTNFLLYNVIYIFLILIMVIIAANVMKSVETSSLTQQASELIEIFI